MDDLENFKVADLKNELKRRGLPVGGNKSELVQRLQQHLLAEESQILLQGGDSATSGDDVDDSLLDTNEDALLGITTEASKVKQPQQQQTTTKTPIPVPKIQVGSGKMNLPLKPSADSTLGSAGGSALGSTTKKSPTKPEVGGAANTNSATVSSPDQKQTVNLKEDVDVKNVDAKLRRAEKFQTGLTEEDKKLQRAQKFGTGNVGTEKNITDDSAAKKSRAERFGISFKPSAASDLDEKKKSRAERFGIQTKSNGTEKTEIPSKEKSEIPSKEHSEISSKEQSEMLKKRAERFGLSQTETIQHLSEQERLAMRKQKFVGIPSTPEVEAKKAKRAERFGT